MILVRAIGMSGYVSLEGVVGLVHMRSDCIVGSYDSGCGCKSKCRFNFVYLSGVEHCKSTDPTFLSKVASFVVFNRFDDSALSVIVRDVGLLSGYHCAGSLFPRSLFHLLIAEVGLDYYRDLGYIPYVPLNKYGQFLCSTAWAEYICIDNNFSCVYWPRFDIRILGHKSPFPDFVCDRFSFLNVKRMLHF